MKMFYSKHVRVIITANSGLTYNLIEFNTHITRIFLLKSENFTQFTP